MGHGEGLCLPQCTLQHRLALCDDGGPRAAGSFVELGKFQCNGNERCQHHLQGGKRGLRTAQQQMQPCHTASLSMQVSTAHPKLSSPDQRLLWAHSLSSGTSDRENAKLQWCCCHPLPVLYPKIHISTGQGNPKFFSLSEWRIFNLFVNYGTVS